MTLSEDGKNLVLYAARTRYDGHQSNITFFLNTDTMTWQSILGEEFPANHVSHSFGQFARFDGDELVTVDHGDAYPRSFVLQTSEFTVDLWGIDGEIGENVTNAIGSGFEVSEDGYLFLGCSDPQTGNGGAWNVFLTFTDRGGVIPQSLTFGSVTVSTEKPTGGYWSLKTGGKTYYTTGCKSFEEVEEAVRAFQEAIASDPNFTWLTQSDTTINCARLVKIDSNTFVAMWAEENDLHWQALNGRGERQGEEHILTDVPMPPNEPLVEGQTIRWIQKYNEVPTLFTLDLECEALILPEKTETAPAQPTTPQIATPTGNTLLVDGAEKIPAAYLINDNNYFKLRDVAALLNGTQAQFSIGWDGVTGAITITTGEAYTALGTELQGKPTDMATAQISKSIIYINGEKIDLSAYLINDNNYFKLRDLGKALGFNVSWDGVKGAVLIESDKPYDDR